MLNSSDSKFSANKTQNRKVRLDNSLVSKKSSIVEDLLRGNIDNFQSTGQFSNTIDFSKFENHVFFDSAVSKVNYAFHQVLNYFPLEENKSAVEKYFNEFDGYTKYIYENKISKSKNALYFDGTSQIDIKNSAGYIFTLSESNKEKLGKKIFSPNLKQFSFDFWVRPTEISSGQKQCVFQSLNDTEAVDTNGAKGFTCFIEDTRIVPPGVEPDSVDPKLSLVIQVSNDNLSSSETNKTIQFSKAKCDISFNKFTHIAINIKTRLGKREIEIFKNGTLVNDSSYSTSSSKSGLDFSNFDLQDNLSFTIGAAKSSHVVSNVAGNSENLLLADLNRFKGILDEFRFFHKTRNASLIIQESKQNIFDQEDLVFCFRFNEPAGEYTNNNVVLDSSNNALHSIIKTSDSDATIAETNVLRSYLSSQSPVIDTPLVYEDEYYSPVIFPEYTSTVDNNENLLKEAAIYDEYNPNLIFKLMPTHYFINSAIDENFNTIYGDIKKSFKPGRTQLGSIQLPDTYPLVNLLVVWARFFDNIKIYLDTFTDLLKTNIHDKTPNRPLLIRMCKLLGLEFKDLFDDTGFLNKKYFDGNTISDIKIDSIQNEIWKRILSSTNQFKVSKGTRQAIKSAIQALGINAESYFDIKEISDQQTFLSTDDLYDLKNKQINTKVLDFSKNVTDFSDIFGYSGNRLSFVTNAIKNSSDESFIKNSWTIEGYYKFNKESLFLMPLTQSLFQVNVTNDPTPPEEHSFDLSVPVFNVVFHKDKNVDTQGRVIAIGRPYSVYTADGENISADNVNIEISNVDLQNGNLWHIAFAREELEKGSNYHLYVNEVKNKDTKLQVNVKSQKIFEHVSDTSDTKFSSIYDNSLSATDIEGVTRSYTNKFNISIGMSKSLTNILNNSAFSLSSAQTVNSKISNVEKKFFGQLVGINVWSKNLSKQEVLSHSRNFVSFSSETPYSDYSLDISKKGLMYSFYTESFIGDTIYDLSQKNIATNIRLIASNGDYSNLSGNEKVKFTTYVSSTKTTFNRLALNNENIIINSLDDESKANLLGIEKTPQFVQSVKNVDKFANSRVLSVEMSNVKHLNEDIDLYTASANTINSLVSNNDTLYCESYQELNDLSNVYFKRHTSKRIDNQPLIKIFRFCDNVLNSLLKDFVPDNMIFLGTNYVIESHTLERHKYTYKGPASFAEKNDLTNNISKSYIDRRTL